jgi:hypothetical protein
MLNAVEIDMPRSSNSFSASVLIPVSILTVKFAVDMVLPPIENTCIIAF